MPAEPRYRAIIFHQDLLVAKLQRFLDGEGYNAPLHECLKRMCEEYRVASPPERGHASLNFDPGNPEHMVVLQNKVANTKSANPHNAARSIQPGQRLPKERRGENIGEAASRFRYVAGAKEAELSSRQAAAPNEAKTLDPLVPLMMPAYIDAWLLFDIGQTF